MNKDQSRASVVSPNTSASPETLIPQGQQREETGIIECVKDKITQRAARGLAKYGKTMERHDLSPIAWLKHAQEEAMDLAVYLERIIQDYRAFEDQYYELIMAVESKYEGETRHETALRYIREREQREPTLEPVATTKPKA